jgi:hypothetical protein
MQTTLAGATGTGTDLVITSGGRIAPKSSSRELKKDITEVDATDLVRDLQPVTFRLKDIVEGEEDYEILGLIAEDVAEVSPVLVNLDADGNPISLDTQALITALIATAQAQDARIAALETALAGLLADGS